MQLDVFAHARGCGNPLGVVFEAEDLDASSMHAIAAWLHTNDVLPARSYLASQGREVGRDGVVECAVDATGEVWIGGQTQTVVAGTLSW